MNTTDETTDTDGSSANTDVLVCGGGLAGLVAAATAASSGASVLVVDPHPVGGRARTRDVAGFSLNDGPHALYRGGHAERVLTELGVGLDGAPVPVSGADALLGGSITTLPVWPSGLLRSKALKARSKPAFARLMTRLPKLDPASVADMSIGQWCKSERLPQDAIAVVEAIARLSTYADLPTDQSAEALLTQLSLGGVQYLHGGWQSIVDALAATAEKAGVRISKARAETVGRSGTPDAAEWVVGLADGSSVSAAAVVLACGGPEAMASVADLPSSWTDRSGPAVRAACLDLGLRSEPPRRFVLGIDEPFYMSRHDPPARLAPEGHSLISVAEYLGPGTEREARAGRERLDDFAARCGIGADRVVKARYLHDMVVAHGTPTAERGGLSGRPAVEIPGCDALFAAGDWIGPDGLLADAALASGQRAGRLASRSALKSVAS